MKVAISGARGLIGTALSESLAADGIQIVALSRKPSVSPPLETIHWDVENGRFDASSSGRHRRRSASRGRADRPEMERGAEKSHTRQPRQ